MRLHAHYARLAAGLAAASLIGACSSGGLGQAGPGSPARLAQRSADAGDFESAAAFYQQAYTANPNSVEALVGLGRSYTGLGQYSRAEQALVAARNRRPNDTEVMLELARTQIAGGNAAGALVNLDAALAKRPNDIAVLTARGIALDRLSRHAEAQATYRKALAKYPTDFALLSNLGLSLGLSGQTSEGISILRELTRDGSATARTRGNLALVYGLAGRDREAAAALASDLSQSQIQNNLAYYRELRGLLLRGKPIGNLEPGPSGTATVAAGPTRPTPAASVRPADGGPATPPITSATLTTAFAPSAAQPPRLERAPAAPPASVPTGGSPQ
jgi:Flp pilus assembly protein TadD